MPKFCVKKPFTVLVAVIMVLVLGVVSLMGMQTDLLPDFSLPYLVVITTYPGASPEKVESAVTEPLESALGTISGVENVTSTSAENYSMVMLEFTEDMDMDSALVKVSSAIDTVEGSLPDLCSTPSIMEISMDMVATMYVAVSWEDGAKDIYDVSDFTEETVIPYLERQAGVASVSDIGLVEQTVQIVLNQEKVDELNDQLLTQVSDRLAEAKTQLEEAQAELDKAQRELETSQESVSDGLAAATEALTQLSAYQTQLQNQQAQLMALQTAKSTAEDSLRQNGVEPDDLASTIDTMSSTASALRFVYNALAAMGVEDDTSLEAAWSALEEIQSKLPEGMELPTSELTGGSISTVGEISSTAFALEEGASGLRTAQTTLEQLEGEITSLTIEIQVTQAIVDQYQKALGSASYSDITSGSISAAAGFGSADAQLATAQSQLESAQEEYESAREEALNSANLDSLLTLDTLSALIYAQNFSMPAGYIDAEGDDQWLLKVGEEFDSVEELESMLLCSLDGIGEVRITDVADVTVIDNTMDSYAKMNGSDAVMLSIFKGSTYGTSQVSKNCNQAIADLEEEYPGLHITVLMDQGDYIQLIVSSIFKNLIEGALLAVLVLILFLKDPRPTLVVAFAIPFSVLFAIVLMYFSNISLNMISMSGLALGIGMLVDNSVVVVENIYRLRARGISVGRAAVQGANQVAGAIVASTLTTICVFLPLLFADGLVKELMGDMGLTIAFSLIASLVVALTVVPTMSVFTLRSSQPKSHKLFDKAMDGYEVALRFCLRRKWVPLTVSVGLLVVSVVAVTRMGIVLLPEIGTNQIEVNVTMPEGITREEAYDRADQVMEKILEVDGIADSGGMSSSTTMSLMSSAATSDDYQSYLYYIMLEDNANADVVSAQLEEKLADVDCDAQVSSSSSMDMSAMMSSGLSLELTGHDLDDLVQASEEVMELVRQVEGFTNLSNGQEDGDTVVQLNIDKDAAMENGLTVAQIYSQLASALTTETSSTTVTVDGSELTVTVVNETEPLALYNLMDYSFDVTVTNEDGEQEAKTITLGDIATISYGTGVASISRENQTRTISVTADTEDGYNTTLLSRQVEKLLDDYTPPDGVTITMGGETDDVNEMVIEMAKMIALAILFVYLVMVAQFQSLLAPFIVLFTMPLAFTGGMLALLIAGEQLSMMSMVGFLVLVGVIVNNGIVFVDYVNQLRLGGVVRTEALVATGRTRMRPILMTALTTIFAMTMMIFSQDTGSQMGHGMALVVVGGLVYGTLMTLFVVPVMYDLFFRREVTQVDVGDDDLDELPDDAAEVAATYQKERGGAAQ
jgi:multidrug efflux pump subunit AcrB